jgi:MFS family permease
MGFFETHQTDNNVGMSLSIILLNYNCAATSYVLYMLQGDEDIDSSSYTFATLSLMLGLFFGQILFGLFGDTIGRKRSFLGSSILLLAGSVLSIFPGMIPVLSGNLATVVEFSIFRFILGVGAGGMYPLVAAITRESSQEDLANTTIALVFGPYGSIGLILAPLIVFLMTGVDVS